ncbi:MAG TPA: Gfo/Idh/MocA family oxidoreductase, partial [Armatimonadetes bacterium]|nr:Gfo/Idh/MocA family oxidoreductase [Armatimonadota bacterium]
MSAKMTRRDFVRSTVSAGVGLWILSNSAFARSYIANEKLNIAIIGAGGRGKGNLDAVKSENIVAICDVDEERAAAAFKEFPKAKKYHDFRKMLDEMSNQIDAVIVSTPDHVHAVASVWAMKLSKHVYCEKPLCYCIHEARIMREVAVQYRVATQMGNQGTA